jgi:hypothetical protein
MIQEELDYALVLVGTIGAGGVHKSAIRREEVKGPEE